MTVFETHAQIHLVDCSEPESIDDEQLLFGLERKATPHPSRFDGDHLRRVNRRAAPPGTKVRPVPKAAKPRRA